MKVLLTITIVTFGFISGWSQCNPYYDIKKGQLLEMTSYNSKGKVQGRQSTEITNYTEKANGWEAAMNIKVYDKKDQLTYEQNEVEVGCDNGVFSMDMARFIPQESIKAFKEMNMDIKVDNLEIPNNLSEGMTLDDGSVTITGDIPMTISTTITNREVEAKEKVTTPAGTFDCYKITYEIGMKMVMNKQMKGVDWIAENVGVVKTESYTNNGKLVGYSLLTSVK